MESEEARGGSHGSHMYKNPHNPTHVNRDAPLPSPTSKAKAAHAHSRFRKISYEVNLLDPHTSTATISSSPPTFPIFATPIIMLAAASSSSTWLRARRIRYLFLLLCSPILIPFLCATFPLLCAAELCLRLCRRRRRKTPNDEAGEEEERMRRCEEGRGSGSAAAGGKQEEKEEMGLLQRYLEDQLLLVGSVYDCGDEYDDADDVYHEIHDYDNDSNTTPLLA